MEHMTVGEVLASLEVDTSKSALFPFPALGLALVVQSAGEHRFLVKVTAPNEPPSMGVLPLEMVGALLTNMTEADTAKQAEGLADEAEAFLKSQAS